MYLAELAPTQLRGLFTQAYTFWYVIGQLLSSVPLVSLSSSSLRVVPLLRSSAMVQ